MPDLRRRVGRPNDSHDKDPATDTARKEGTEKTNTRAESLATAAKGEAEYNPDRAPLLLRPFAKLRAYLTKPRGKRRNSFIFLLGGLFGIVVALFFANQNEVISLDALFDLNLDSLIDVVPSGLLRDANEFTVCAVPMHMD